MQAAEEQAGTDVSGARASQVVRIVVAALIGLGIGAATSFAQSGLDGTWQALSNSASPWLLGSFVAGAIQLRRGWAVSAGLGTCVLAVAAYYMATAVRSYPVSHTEVAFWTVCAVVGGPVFGWVAWTWRHASFDLRPIGGSFVPATFVAEAVGTYQLRLHYYRDVVLYAVLGLALLAVVVISTRQPTRAVLATAIVSLAGILIYWLGLDAAGGAVFGA